MLFDPIYRILLSTVSITVPGDLVNCFTDIGVGMVRSYMISLNFLYFLVEMYNIYLHFLHIGSREVSSTTLQQTRLGKFDLFKPS